MKVVFFDTETSEHITLNDVWKVVDGGRRMYIYYYESKIQKTLAKICKAYITQVTMV